MFTVKSGFIGEFKHGDNINYNLQILQVLYKTYNNLLQSDAKKLHKPIIILIVAIIESVIYDLFFRMKHHTAEGVNNIPQKMICNVQNKQYKTFSNKIDLCKKYDVFSLNPKGYEVMNKLKDLRNRIHIQNEKNDKPKNECNAFTSENKEYAEVVCELILKDSYQKFRRAENLHCVDDFQCPWKEKFPHFNEKEQSNK